MEGEGRECTFENRRAQSRTAGGRRHDRSHNRRLWPGRPEAAWPGIYIYIMSNRRQHNCPLAATELPPWFRLAAT
eukprot:4094377-Heterocapsa_arctica.AAC.1